MTKLAICLKSCHRDLDAGFHSAIRETWGQDAKASGVDVFFFLGRDAMQQETRQLRRYVSGEVVLDCPDDYDSLPFKTRRICQWVMNKMFTHVFLCDTDTYVNVKNLLKTGFEKYDYLGKFLVGEPGGAPFNYTDEYGSRFDQFRGWASGGFGYFLSRKAVDIVADTRPAVWAEDAYVGQSLAPALDKGELKGGNIDLDNTFHATEHWNKKRITTPFTPDAIRLAHKNGGFRELFKKGIYMP